VYTIFYEYEYLLCRAGWLLSCIRACGHKSMATMSVATVTGATLSPRLARPRVARRCSLPSPTAKAAKDSASSSTRPRGGDEAANGKPFYL